MKRPAPRLRLIVCGGISLLLGSGLLALTALSSMLALAGFAAVEGAGPGPAAVVGAAVVYGALGLAFVILGWGSIRLRRWAPPLISPLASLWLLCGILTTIAGPVLIGPMLELSLERSAQYADPAVILASRLFVFAFSFLFGVVLPALFLWVYRDPAVARYCAEVDRRPSWTDDCPRPVLGLSILLALFAVLAVPLAFRPVLPLFGVVLRGAPALVATILLGAASAYLAWTAFLRRPVAWWSTTLSFLVLGLSYVITTFVANVEDWLAMVGWPPEIPGPRTIPGSWRWGLAAVSIGLTLGGWIYMVRLKRYFDTSSDSDVTAVDDQGIDGLTGDQIDR